MLVRPTQLPNQFIFGISFTRPCQWRRADFFFFLLLAELQFGLRSLVVATEHRDSRVIIVTVALPDRHGVCSSRAEAPAVCVPQRICGTHTRCSAMIPCCHQQKSGFCGTKVSPPRPPLLSRFSCFNSFCLLTTPKSRQTNVAALHAECGTFD